MPQNNVQIWSDFVLQQLAAESYFDNLKINNREDTVAALLFGNNPIGSDPTGVSRMASAQAEAFVDRYHIIHQYKNDGSGFSATLLFDKRKGQYTLSFRSTEFRSDGDGGDRSRDVMGAGYSIRDHGFAFAQIASMEDYYAHLKRGERWDDATRTWRGDAALGDFAARSQGAGFLNVTGYSLGGHLASVFTELHASEIAHTYIFNSAGRGGLRAGASVRDVVTVFNDVLKDPQAWRRYPALFPPGSISESTPQFERARKLAERAPAFSPNSPANIYADARYVWAAAVASRLTDPIVTANGSLPADADGKITRIIGRATHNDSAPLSLTGIFPTRDTNTVFIEDQPDLVALGGLLSFLPGDFGNTHSITLLVDSLALMDALQTIAPALTQSQIETIFAASSNQRAVGGLTGRAEADSLENALDALRKLLIGPNISRTPFSDSVNGFGRIDNRDAFYRNLDQLIQGAAAKSTALSITPITGTSAAELAEIARSPDAIELRYALREMNPFTVTGDGSLYAQHNRNGELDLYQASTGKGDFTPEYLADRAGFLALKIKLNLDDTAFALAGGNQSTVYHDAASEYRAYVFDAATAQKAAAVQAAWGLSQQDMRRKLDLLFETQATRGTAQKIRFGTGSAEIFTGAALGDRLYGGGGKDLLVGRGGSDYLQGDGDVETLNAGAGDDVLAGGAGDDKLHGGEGLDVYRFQRAGGRDSIIDYAGDEFGGDGKGRLEYLIGVNADGSNAIQNIGGQVSALDANNKTFRDAALGYTYTFTGILGETPAQNSRGTLTITRDDDPGTRIQILNFSSGDLGITLLASTQARPVSDKYGSDDNDNGLLHRLSHRDSLIADTEYQRVFGLGGSDSIQLAAGHSEGRGGADNDYLVNDAGEQSLYGEDGRDVLLASAGDDRLFGGAGDDALQGGADDDYLDGGSGNDVLDGGPGEDFLSGGDANDFIFGGGSLTVDLSDWDAFAEGSLLWGVSFSGEEPILAGLIGVTDLKGDGADVLGGGEGDDWLVGGGGDDLLAGDAGRDTLIGGADADTLMGGAGSDRLFGDATRGDVRLGGQPYFTEPGANGDDALLGGADNDYLQGDGGSDELYGGDGNDVLVGDASGLEEQYHGGDYLDGGEGDDTLYGYGKDDQLSGAAGDDYLEGDSNTIEFALHGDDLLDGGSGNDHLQGDGGADSLFGGEGDDRLFGDSDDTPAAFQGNDYLDGGEGKDALRGYGGDDTLYGGEGDDQLRGDAGNDILDGGEGADTLAGGPGDDAYFIDAQDTILDDQGTNVITFTDATRADDLSLDAITVDGTAQVQYSLGGHVFLSLAADKLDTASSFSFGDSSVIDARHLLGAKLVQGVNLSGTTDDDAMAGHAGDDLLQGAAGDDTLFGYAGVDELRGGEGNDMLEGGRDHDLLTGEAGSDTYVFSRGDGADTISDGGDTNSIDILEFSDIDSSEITVSHLSNGDLVFTLDGNDDQVTVQGFFTQPGNRIEGVVYADGTGLGLSELLDIPLTPQLGTAAADTLVGTQFADVLLGLAGNDSLDGGFGNDQLNGGAGQDTYKFGYGMGSDTVIDPDNAGLFVLDTGLTADSLAAHRAGDHLALTLRGSSEGMTLNDYFSSPHDWVVQDAAHAQTSLDAILDATAQRETGLVTTYHDDVLAGLTAQVTRRYLDNRYAIAGEGALRRDPVANADLISAVYQRTSQSSTDAITLNGVTTATTQASTNQSFDRTQVTLRDSSVSIQHVTTSSNDEVISAQYLPYTLDSAAQSSSSIRAGVSWNLKTSHVDRSTLQVTEPMLGATPGLDGHYPIVGTRVHDSLTDNETGGGTGRVTGIFSASAPITTSGRLDLPNLVNATLITERIDAYIEDIIAGDGDNTITGGALVDGGAGNDSISGAYFAYGNAGSDTITGAFIAFGGAGDDIISGANAGYGGEGNDTLAGVTLVGGRGDDTMMGTEGASGFLIEAGDGIDSIIDNGDDALAYRNAYYEGLGISDWQFREAHGGQYHYTLEFSPATYFDSAADALAYVNSFAPVPITAEDAVQTYGLTLIEALPGRPPEIAGNDYAALQPLIDAGTIKADIVLFGDGITRSSITLTREQEHTGSGLVDINLVIGTGGSAPGSGPADSVRITLAQAADPIGTGIEYVEFHDGTRARIGDLVALAAPLITNEPPAENHPPVLNRALGDQSATEQSYFIWQVPGASFGDEDAGDTLSYRATLSDGAPLPAWLAFDGATRTFSGIPTAGERGAFGIEVSATDHSQASAAARFTLTIAAAAQEPPPVLLPPANEPSTPEPLNPAPSGAVNDNAHAAIAMRPVTPGPTSLAGSDELINVPRNTVSETLARALKGDAESTAPPPSSAKAADASALAEKDALIEALLAAPRAGSRFAWQAADARYALRTEDRSAPERLSPIEMAAVWERMHRDLDAHLAASDPEALGFDARYFQQLLGAGGALPGASAFTGTEVSGIRESSALNLRAFEGLREGIAKIF